MFCKKKIIKKKNINNKKIKKINIYIKKKPKQMQILVFYSFKSLPKLCPMWRVSEQTEHSNF